MSILTDILEIKKGPCQSHKCNKINKQILLKLKKTACKMKIFVQLLQKTVCVPKVKFSDGNEIPIIGLGTYLIKKKGETERAVKFAIDVGYRHIDCAAYYRNEDEVGKAINQKICEGVIKREEIFVTGKLWNTDHRAELVEKALRKSLKDLQLEYIDLYLMHWPHALKEGKKLMPKDSKGKLQFSSVDYVDTWKEMGKLKECGLAKSIGISNFNKRQIERLLCCSSTCPVSLQIECHPYFNQARLINFAKEKRMMVTAYSPLGAPGVFKAKQHDLGDHRILEIAKKYKKSPAQIAIRYQIEREVIVIPKSVTKERIKENFDVFDFSIDTDDMDCLNGMDMGCKGRTMWFEASFGHPDHPFENDDY